MSRYGPFRPEDAPEGLPPVLLRQRQQMCDLAYAERFVSCSKAETAEGFRPLEDAETPADDDREPEDLWTRGPVGPAFVEAALESVKRGAGCR